VEHAPSQPLTLSLLSYLGALFDDSTYRRDERDQYEHCHQFHTFVLSTLGSRSSIVQQGRTLVGDQGCDWTIEAPFAATVHLLDRYSISLERMVRLVQTAVLTINLAECGSSGCCWVDANSTVGGPERWTRVFGRRCSNANGVTMLMGAAGNRVFCRARVRSERSGGHFAGNMEHPPNLTTRSKARDPQDVGKWTAIGEDIRCGFWTSSRKIKRAATLVML
jgi:hypothetical protein